MSEPISDAIHAAVTWLSLSLSPMTILMCVAVVFLFWPAFTVHSKRMLKGGNLEGFSYMIVGVAIGFIGDAVDNLYWMLAWDADFRQLGTRDFLFNNGVYSNTPFRQGATIIAAVLHLIGSYKLVSDNMALVHDHRAMKAVKIAKVGVYLSGIYALFLIGWIVL